MLKAINGENGLIGSKECVVIEINNLANGIEETEEKVLETFQHENVLVIDLL